MQWIRSHLSFANVISVIALFVALGGASYAAVTLPKNSVGPKQIKKRAVRAKHINKNAVSASKIQRNSISSSKIADGSVLSSDLADNSVGSGELADNSVGSGELQGDSVTGDKVPANALTADDIDGSTLDPEVGPDAYARVASDAARTLQVSPAGFPPQTKGLVQANVVPGEGAAVTGTTCFDLPFRPAFAGVTLDNADAAAADRNLVASVAIDRGEDLGDCPGADNDARVRIVDGNTEAPQNARFFVWFER